MSALTPACAHAVQNVRPGRRAGDIGRPIVSGNNHRYLPNIRTISVSAHAFRGWAIFTDGGTHTRGGETAGCGAIARSSLRVCYVMCGPVITVEARVAFAGASQHTNNTVKFSGIIESHHFLSLDRFRETHVRALSLTLDTLRRCALDQCSYGPMSVCP